MRVLLLIALLFMVFAAAPGTARDNGFVTEISSSDHPEPLPHDAICGEGVGHGSCQWVMGTAAAALPPSVALADAAFAIQPVRATGQGFAPQPPPPRQLC